MSCDEFWVLENLDKDDPNYARGWCGVVSEEKGGIIAYFGDIKDAEAFCAMKNTAACGG